MDMDQKVPQYLGGRGLADEPLEVCCYLAAEAPSEAARIRE